MTELIFLEKDGYLKTDDPQKLLPETTEMTHLLK